MSTVFVTLSDSSYYGKGVRTVQELRDYGKWTGDVVYIAVDFDPNPADLPNVIIYRTSHINTNGLLESFRKNPIKPMPDNRHFGKLYQWDKLQVFKPFFRQWDRVVFLDAGLRVFDSVQPLLDLSWKERFLGPDDSEPYDNGKRFRIQVDIDANPAVNELLFTEFPIEILESKYFNNCIFAFDTRLTYQVSFEEMEEYMNKFPIFMCNETGLMNIIFNFKLGVWDPFPQLTSEGKYLFGWAENNYRERPNWERFHFIKYPVSIDIPRPTTIEKRYIELCHQESDIYEHLPTLAAYSSLCNHITECGVRGAVSSYALALGIIGKQNAKLVQVDPDTSTASESFRIDCHKQGIPVVYYQQSDLECPIEPTDLLFIDTWHVYGQLKRELDRWHSSVRKYIILHDTEVDKWRGEVLRRGWDAVQMSKDSGIPSKEITRGLWPAVAEFVRNNKQWRIEEVYKNCNGLTVLTRVPSLPEYNAVETMV